jgi:ubiquinone/menaquinone biosynthesis C-methylase UbiE
MVSRAATRADSLAVASEISVGDARNLSFASGTFDAVLLHLVLSVVPDPEAVMAETARVLKPDGQVSIYDKFVAEGEKPSFIRWALNPLTRTLFSDITRQLVPTLSGTSLETGTRESFVGGIYTVTVAEPAASLRSDCI